MDQRPDRQDQRLIQMNQRPIPLNQPPTQTDQPPIHPNQPPPRPADKPVPTARRPPISTVRRGGEKDRHENRANPQRGARTPGHPRHRPLFATSSILSSSYSV